MANKSVIISADDKSNKNGGIEIEEGTSSIIGFFSLFRFATKWEIFLILIGVIFTILNSCVEPLLTIGYGEFTCKFIERTSGLGNSSPTILLRLFGGGVVLTNATHEESLAEMVNDSIAYIMMKLTIATYSFVTGILTIDMFNYTALKQVTRIRIRFFHSLIRQDIAWYDVSSGTNFAVRMTEDVEKFRDGIAEKVSQMLGLIATSVICLMMSFAYGWKLALAMISYMPIVIVTSMIFGKIQAKLAAKEIDAYALAANVAEEVLGGIRTVVSFGGEKAEFKRYVSLLEPARKAGKRKGLFSGIIDGVNQFMLYVSQAFGYWYGARLVLADRDSVDKEYTPAVVIIVTFGLYVATENFGRIAPFLESMAAARGSATTIFKIIDRVPKIDPMSADGKILDSAVEGDIEFRNVEFSYPSRPDVLILRDMNLTIRAGQTVALVGRSGNGKSTILHLLQRFYDLEAGQILLDGCDISQLNISFLRSNIALVGQEPVLFSTSIGENIRYGKPNASEQEIIAAATEAGAHDFISRLPQGYDTLVGEKGSQMSGGQKQRISIARALIQNPRILLLDEATSALDYQSEKYVQRTLDSLSEGRTTIVVSHRISAIRNADRILFIEKGEVLEDGSHSDLLELKGRYYDMITAGTLSNEETSTIDRDPRENASEKSFDANMTFTDKSCGGSTDSESEIEATKEKTEYWASMKRIVTIARPEWFYLFFATCAALIVGSSVAITGILFAEVYNSMALLDAEESANATFRVCMQFVAAGTLMFVASLCQTHWFNMAGVYLTTRIRSITFDAMMRQEIGWFDDVKHSVGALSARLSGDAASVQDAIGFPFSRMIHCIAIITLGVAIGFYYSWKLALMCTMCFPLVILLVYLEAKHMAQATTVEKSLIEEGSKIASEAIANIRTVASLRQEPHMIERFISEMNKIECVIRKKVFWRGIVQSSARAIPLLIAAPTFSYGGYMIAKEEIHFTSIIKITEPILAGVGVLARCLVFIPSFTTAFVAAQRLFKIIDREPQISSPNFANDSRLPDIGKNIEYKRIDFRYPTRSDVQVLKSLDLNIADGQTVALVGPSGSGKSTLIQLLQRFYDPDHGRIHIGQNDISSDISLDNLRSRLSLVSQEPVLFDRTIAENIAYGDNSREVQMFEIIAAAQSANIHSFIVTLPSGYNTNVGSKGAQLSGGQKQRIAIARALLKNPQILLLDEATSALDHQSEQIVQQALDSARSGRTCLVIAHRLSTVQNADVICVIQNGEIVEKGTHRELLALNGAYTKLYNAQK